MGYIENLMKRLPLTADEKKELDKIETKILGFQKDLKAAFRMGIADKACLENILATIADLAKSRKKEMQRVWERRKKALMGM